MTDTISIYWDDGEIANGSLQDVIVRIQALDGNSQTVVLIEHAGVSIGVGGGNNGNVISYYTRDNWNFYNLIGNPSAIGKLELVAGGQPGDYDNKYIVSLETAVKAVSELIKGGKLSFEWESQYGDD